MHELSIAQNLIEVACEALTDKTKRIRKLNVRIGRMSGVVTEALRFSFELAAEGTACAGAVLAVEEVPVSVYCRRCEKSNLLETLHCFACPDCGQPTSDIRGGKELDLISLEIDGDETPCP